MSYRWPNKDPNEILDYTLDWAKLIPSGVTINTVDWFINDEEGVRTQVYPASSVYGLVVVETILTGVKTTIVFTSGTNNYDYKVFCSVTLSNGNVLERSVRLSIKDF